MAEALEELPRLAGALASGALGWCAARELTRVVVPDTEQTWLEAARGKTQRELEALVADKSPGDAPDTPGASPARRHVLRFEVAADTFATFREAMQRLQRAAGGRLDQDALLLAMARHVLRGPADDGRGSYQISLHVCAACSRGEQMAGGELVPVDDAVVRMAECDAQHLGLVLAPVVAQRAVNENADELEIDSGTTGRCSDHAHVSAVAIHAESDGTGTPAVPATPTKACAAPGTRKDSLPRARQTVQPALRRAVLDRDRHRCQVPGCTHTTYVDVHHIQRRADGGLNVSRNLLTLCSAHHRATHNGELLVERGSEGAIVFRHADGTAYGDAAAPRRVDAQTQVFSALRHLGFRESEVQAVLAELRVDGALADATVERLLREALRRIKPRAR